MLNTVAVLALLAAGGPPDDPPRPPAPATDLNGFSLPAGAVARLGHPDRRHRGPAEWVAFSDDDRLLARPVDGVVQIFDLNTGRDVTPGYLKDHAGAVLRFLPDGRHLLYRQADKRCDVRDPTTGRVLAGFDVPGNGWGELVGPAADGQRVLVRYRDTNGLMGGLVADLGDDPPAARTFRGATSADSWALSADGKRLFQGWDRGVAAYDAAGGERIALAPCRYRNSYPLVPSPDGGRVIAGWERGTATFELTADGFGEPGPANVDGADDFALAPDGKTIVRAGVGVIDATGALTAVEPAHDRTSLRAVRFSRSAGRCVDVFYDRPPVVWDPRTGKTVFRFDGHYAAGVGLGVSADGTVSLRHADRTVRVYAADGRPLADRTGLVGRRATQMLGVSPDGTASVEYDPKDRKVSTRDTATGSGTAWPQEFASPPFGVRFDATGRRVYLAGTGYGGVFEVASGRRVRAAESAGAAAISDDGRALAVVGRKEFRVYELLSGKERATAEVPATDFDTSDEYRFRRSWDDEADGPALPRGQMQFSADGRRVAFFWTTGRVSVFDAADGALRYREPRLWNATRYAAFRPDGEWFATTTRTQRRIALRNITEPKADRSVVVLADVKSNVVGLAFTPDGRRLVSAHEDGTALVWDVEAAVRTLPREADPEPGDALWAGLASADAKLAGKAVAGLIARPDVAVPLLAEMVRPAVAPNAERVKAEVEKLADRDFKVRDAAEKQLRAWGELAAEPLTAAEPTATPEQGERIRRLLDALDGEETDAERLRLLRAVEVLERIGSQPAVAVLEKLGGGAAGSVVTREAKEAAKRVRGR
jgi:WD40 repeat protein